MQCVSLTDDELWRVIAENTNAMSRLVHQQLELDAYLGANDPYKGHLMRFSWRGQESFSANIRTAPLSFAVGIPKS
jgi:hypothetical protein